VFDEGGSPVLEEDGTQKTEPISGAFAQYSTAEGTYSQRILIGFCTFVDIGNNADANSTAAIGLNLCTTECCVDHCLFLRCSDALLMSWASSGNLFVGNLVQDAVDPVSTGDGNGVDMKGCVPRTETAWPNRDPDKEPLKNAVFDNVFLRYHGAIIIHYGCRYLDIFNNQFIECETGAAFRSDCLWLISRTDLLRCNGGVLPEWLVDPGIFFSCDGFRKFDTLLERGTGQFYIQMGDIWIYRNLIDGTSWAFQSVDVVEGIWDVQGSPGISVSLVDLTTLTYDRGSEVISVGCEMRNFWIVSNTIVNCDGPAVYLGRVSDYEGVGSLVDVGIYCNAFSNNEPIARTPIWGERTLGRPQPPPVGAEKGTS